MLECGYEKSDCVAFNVTMSHRKCSRNCGRRLASKRSKLGCLRQLPGARLATLVGLPVLTRTDVETREPAVAVDPGVDADRMADVAGDARFLRRVAAHHDLPRLVRRRV